MPPIITLVRPDEFGRPPGGTAIEGHLDLGHMIFARAGGAQHDNPVGPTLFIRQRLGDDRIEFYTRDDGAAPGFLTLLKHAIDILHEKTLVGLFRQRNALQPFDAVGPGPAQGLCAPGVSVLQRPCCAVHYLRSAGSSPAPFRWGIYAQRKSAPYPAGCSHPRRKRRRPGGQVRLRPGGRKGQHRPKRRYRPHRWTTGCPRLSWPAGIGHFRTTRGV